MSNDQQLRRVLRQFNLDGEPTVLPGGSTQTFRVGHAVLKHIKETSLENNHSPGLIQWIAAFSTQLQEDGFRIPKPLPTVSKTWITRDGWTAWTFVEGRHATHADIPTCIVAIIALHKALKPIPNIHCWMTTRRHGAKPTVGAGGSSPLLFNRSSADWLMHCMP